MRTLLTISILMLALGALTCLEAQPPMPQMKTVEPTAGKAGDVITVNGANLDKTSVSEVYLTDGKNDTKVVVVEQKPDSIRFRIPPSIKPGRLAVMILTAGSTPKLIEEPVKVTIESEN